jgi:hypothetical protein
MYTPSLNTTICFRIFGPDLEPLISGKEIKSESESKKIKMENLSSLLEIFLKMAIKNSVLSVYSTLIISISLNLTLHLLTLRIKISLV